MKQLEHQKMLESKNSSYKLDDASAEFYRKLQADELMKEKSIKENERIELEQFSKLRQDSLKQKKSEGSVKYKLKLSSTKIKPTPIIKKKNESRSNVENISLSSSLMEKGGKLNNIIKGSNIIESSDVQKSKTSSSSTTQEENPRKEQLQSLQPLQPILAEYGSSEDEI